MLRAGGCLIRVELILKVYSKLDETFSLSCTASCLRSANHLEDLLLLVRSVSAQLHDLFLLGLDRLAVRIVRMRLNGVLCCTPRRVQIIFRASTIDTVSFKRKRFSALNPLGF